LKAKDSTISTYYDYYFCQGCYDEYYYGYMTYNDYYNCYYYYCKSDLSLSLVSCSSSCKDASCFNKCREQKVAEIGENSKVKEFSISAYYDYSYCQECYDEYVYGYINYNEYYNCYYYFCKSELSQSLVSCSSSCDNASCFNKCKETQKGVISLNTKVEDSSSLYYSYYCQECYDEYYYGYITYTQYYNCYYYFCKEEVSQLATSLVSEIKQNSCDTCANEVSNFYSCVQNCCKAEIVNKFISDKLELVKKDNIELSHCNQCYDLYYEGYYTYNEYAYCYYWYCKNDLTEQAKLYFEQKSSSYVSMGGITVVATVFVGIAYMSTKKRREGDSEPQVDYRSL